MTERGGVCTHWDGQRWCHATDGVRLYLVGHRCASHTPARLAGRAEPKSTPMPTRAAGTTNHEGEQR